MFIHETHMPQLLAAEHYTSPDHLEREFESMFEPGWHCVASTADFPNDGDYVTREIYGRPLIIWRIGGQYHTFLNVCTHRFSMLRDKPCGHMGDRLKCQYHGWEYNCDGDTQRIPDAQSFKPMKKGELGLRKFHTETVGQLIYVSLADDPPGLDEYLGEYIYGLCEAWFSPDHDFTCAIDCHHESNWKVVIENVLEGYHVESVHPKSFGTYPEHERCSHEFHDVWDHYRDDYSRHAATRSEAIVSRIAGVEPEYVWHHLLRYPNVVFGKMALFTWCQTVVPISANECTAHWRIFVYPGKRGSLKAKLLSAILRRWGEKFMRQVVGEDAAIYPAIHRGISSPIRPNGGLVSIREERIFPFQKHVRRMTGLDPAHKEVEDVREPVGVGRNGG